MGHATSRSTDIRVLTSSDGHTIFAEASGDHSKPHVVIIHGLAMSGAVFDDFCKRSDLLKGLYIVRYDLRGHGRSGMPATPAGHESHLYANDFKTVMEAFGLHKPVLVGWSMGGITGADVAAHLPEDTISGIYYLSSAFSSMAILNGAATAQLLQIIAYHADPAAIPKATVELVDACLASPAAPEPSYQLRCQLAGSMALQSAVMRGLVHMRIQEADPIQKLLGSGLPVFLLYGVQDKLVNGDFVEQELRKVCKALDVRKLPDAGHTLFWEQPDIVASTLLKFASRLK